MSGPLVSPRVGSSGENQRIGAQYETSWSTVMSGSVPVHTIAW